MSRILLVLFACSAGCGTPWTQTFEHGGSASFALAPVTDGEGVTVDLQLAGMSDEEVDRVGTDNGTDCAAPFVTYATDTASGEPLFGVLVMCADEVEMQGSCPGPVSFVFDVEGDTGDLFLDMDPIGDDTPMGDQFWVSGALDVENPMLGSSGALEGVVSIDDGCMTEPVDHTLAVSWDFPLHTEVRGRDPFDWSVRP